MELLDISFGLELLLKINKKINNFFQQAKGIGNQESLGTFGITW